MMSSFAVSRRKKLHGVLQSSRHVNRESRLLSSLSIPGVAQVFDAQLPWYKRLPWAAFILICLGLCIFQVGERMQNYFSHPSILVYEFQKESLSKIYLPEFTICGSEGFNSEELYNLRLARLLERNDSIDTVANVTYLLKLDDINLNTIWNLSGFNLNTYLVKCQYANSKDCRSSSFWRPVYTFLGKCYTLHIDEPVRYDGPSSGVIVNFKNLWIDPTKMRMYFVQLRGLLHAPNDDIRYDVMTFGSYLFLQTANSISYEHRKFEHLNKTKHPCFSKEYYTSCRIRCLDDIFYRNFKCRFPFMDDIKRGEMCSTPEELNRFLFSQDKVSPQNYLPLTTTECNAKCGPPCNYHTFDGAPDATLAATKGSMFSYSPMKDGTTVYRETENYSFNQLLCDFGSLIGLYLGISVITLIEVIEFVVDEIALKRHQLL